MSITHFLLFILSISLIISFSYCLEPVNDKHTQVFSLPPERKSGQYAFIADLSKDIVIKVRGNKTNGYEWYVQNAEFIDGNKILKTLNLNDEFDTSDYFEDKTDGAPQVGIGGNYYFKFKPLKEGEAKVKFINKRHWNKDDVVKVEVDISVVKTDKNKSEL